jgi:hypothetical protein
VFHITRSRPSCVTRLPRALVAVAQAPRPRACGEEMGSEWIFSASYGGVRLVLTGGDRRWLGSAVTFFWISP